MIKSIALAAALAAAHQLALASIPGISDAVGDFLPTFAGSSSQTDLDVVSASVTYDVKTDMFVLTSTMAGAIGTTTTAAYVWGVDRGTGFAAFAPQGYDGVRFDGLVSVLPDGTASAGGLGALAALPSGSVSISGNTITAHVAGSFLPTVTGGFTNKLNYTWNLWPEDGAYISQGFFATFADFAPDNSNFTTTPFTSAVPEPETYALMLAGLGVVGALARRRGARRD